MLARLRGWMEETHGCGFELLRHFVQGFFETEFTSVPGEWQKVAGGVLAAVLSVGLLGFNTYIEKYNGMQAAGFPAERMYREIRSDLLSLATIAMAAAALFAVLLWQSLFPSLRDYLALAGLPLRPRQIFQAKAGAVALAFAVFVLAMTVPPAAGFAVAVSDHWRFPSGLTVMWADFAAMAGGCTFVFFTLLACQGALLNILPARAFPRASMALQAAVFVATLGGLPLIGWQPESWWWPPACFLRLWDAIAAGRGRAAPAVWLMGLPVAVSAAAYLASYHRYRRLLVEGERASGARSGRERHHNLLDRWIRDPRELAAFTFIARTLARSRSHRLILLAFAGLALGWTARSALDTPAPTLHNQGVYGLLVAVAPLALSLLVALGLRYLFSLPVALRANWIFQITDRGGRIAWLAAVERFVTWCGIGPVFLAALPAGIALLGIRRAAAITALGFLAAAISFEWFFRNWCKLPFTCSYIPGKRPAWALLLRGIFAVPFLGLAGELILYSSDDQTAFLALFTFELAVYWRMRAGRRKRWSETALLYEELPEAVITPLELQPAETLTSAAIPPPETEIFSDTLIASHGLLPAAWAEEIAAEPRSAGALLGTFREDIRYGWRLIRRSPLFSAVVVLTLTIGIGINASVFTVVSGLALRPHVYKDPASFVRIYPETRTTLHWREASYAEYLSWRERSRSVRQLAAFTYFPVLIGDDDATGYAGLVVSCNFFLVDGLDRPTLGRLLDAQDCLSRGQTPVAVISESTWHNRLGSDPHVIGRLIQVNNSPVVVVGVAPDRTGGWTRPASIWLPYTAMSVFSSDRDLAHEDQILWLSLAGRMAPGYSRQQVEAEFAVLARQDSDRRAYNTAFTTTDGSWMQDLYVTAPGRDLMLVGFFLGAFNLVLLIACANVATLLLARAASRRREIAVRLSLGAPRIRLIRMLVTESLLLAAMAGGISAWLVWRLPGPLYRTVASRAPDFPMSPDWGTFAYISAVVLLTGILAGLAPALESLKVDLAASMKGLSPVNLGSGRLRGILVAAQVALSMVLLVEAGLFAHSEDRNLRGEPGYTPERVVVLPMRFARVLAPQAAAARIRAIEERVRSLPGVLSVAFSDRLPMIRCETVSVRPPGRPDASQPVDVYTGSPHFLETMGVPLLAGRDFQESDGTAVIVSQALALAFWHSRNPVGRTFTVPDLGTVTVVGMARDVSPLRVGGSENPAVYVPAQIFPYENTLSARVAGDASAAAPMLRAEIRRTFADAHVLARPLQKWIDEITETLWNVVALIIILGLVATVLATTGIYGAVSFAVSQRTRELGIRVALGAQRLDILREVLVSGGKPVAQGLLVGLWLSVAMAAGLRQSVKGSPLRLDTSNPLLYVAAVLLLGVAAVLAMLPPAHRGAKADPLDALRCE